MDFIRTLLIIGYAIVCVLIIILALLQSKNDEGASGAITGGGGGESSFYEKNKGRTREGRLKRWTVILGIIFGLGAVVLSVVYMV